MPYGQGLPSVFPNLTWQSHSVLKKVLSRYESPSCIVFDLGAGGRRLRHDVLTVDYVPSSNTDIVGDVCNLGIASGCADLVIATGVLEHVDNDVHFISEITRITRQGGGVYLEVPFMQYYHDDPIDCRRLTMDGLARLMDKYGFQVKDSGCHIGPSVTLITVIAYYMQILFEGNTVVGKVLSNLAFWIVSVLLYPLKFLDFFLKHKKSSHRLAFGVYVYAIKK